MKKWYIILLTFLVLVMFKANLFALEYKPLISGNYQHGIRSYSEEEGVGDDYLFREGWIRYRQKITSNSFYYVKLRFYESDYMSQEIYDSFTVDLSSSITYYIIKPLKFQMTLQCRDKQYRVKPEKNYYAIFTNLGLGYKFSSNQISCTLAFNREFYPFSDRDNLLSNLGLRWERDIKKGFTIYSQLNFSGQNFYFSTQLSDRAKHSVSIGFDYQM